MNTTLQGHSNQYEKLLQAVLDTKLALEVKIDSVVQEVNLLQVDHHKLADSVARNEPCLTTVQPALRDLQTQVMQLTTPVSSLQRRAEDVEGRLRRNTICFLGFLKCAEAPSAELCLELWLITTVLGNKLPPFFSIKRAHQILHRPLPPGDQPRPLIARLFNFRDRDLVL
ncbi:hypothetical protein NDU88_005240 [Pleurodeles waltl]|uniref:Uncharacterized protein n=1 Tax=Pleurodeles waltl TaxID=8319 RepID=A0AAV7UHJ4_PLEWA|nr:hypothetical protein NDU88_005240 [Pleurodeles waltl]